MEGVIGEGWQGQLEIALRNTIRNEIITASGDGTAKPSQYLEGCVKSILGQIEVYHNLLRDELVELTDKLGYDDGNKEHLKAFQKCQIRLLEHVISIEHKYY